MKRLDPDEVARALGVEKVTKNLRHVYGKSTYKYRDPEKWRAYMREYMRKRRASKRSTPVTKT